MEARIFLTNPIAPKVKSKVTAGFNAYHNQSSIIFGSGKNNDLKKEEPIKPKKTVGSDKPVWNYDPKTAGKTTMILGTDKPDYRKKDEVYKERTPTTLTNSRKKW